MGLNFRKSITVLPGVKVNLSKSGVGLSVGIPGIRGSINTSGRITGSVGLPGTGLSYRKSTNVKKVVEKLTGEEAEKKTKGGKGATADDQAAPAKNAGVKCHRTGETAGTKAAKGELAKQIMAIYSVGDQLVDWGAIQNSTSNIGYEQWDYLKSKADKILDGDIDTYFEVVCDVNPFDDLISYGSNFECDTDSPMKMHIKFDVNSNQVFAEDKDLLEDYVAGVVIRSARDMFALLPVWSVSVDAVDGEKTLCSISFNRGSFDELNFAKLDASDTIRQLGGMLNL